MWLFMAFFAFYSALNTYTEYVNITSIAAGISTDFGNWKQQTVGWCLVNVCIVFFVTWPVVYGGNILRLDQVIYLC